MTDTVLGGGHASRLMDEIMLVSEAPQIHLHFLTPDGQAEARVEVCCHGCGKSLTISYWENHPRSTKHLKAKDSFVKVHSECGNHGYEKFCPNWRSSFEVLDLRPKRRHVLSAFQGQAEDSALLQSSLQAQLTDGTKEKNTDRRGR